MAGRIFTSNDREQYSPRELNTIDWRKVASNMKSVQDAVKGGQSFATYSLVTGNMLRSAQTAMEQDMPDNEGAMDKPTKAPRSKMPMQELDAALQADDEDPVERLHDVMLDNQDGYSVNNIPAGSYSDDIEAILSDPHLLSKLALMTDMDDQQLEQELQQHLSSEGGAGDGMANPMSGGGNDGGDTGHDFDSLFSDDDDEEEGLGHGGMGGGMGMGGGDFGDETAGAGGNTDFGDEDEDDGFGGPSLGHGDTSMGLEGDDAEMGGEGDFGGSGGGFGGGKGNSFGDHEDEDEGFGGKDESFGGEDEFGGDEEGDEEGDESFAPARAAGRKWDHLKSFQFGKKSKDGEKKDDEKEEKPKDKKAKGDKKEEETKEKNVRRGKDVPKKDAKASGPIIFTKPSQISAAAIEAAKAAGNVRLYKAILAAREERRERLAQRLEESARVTMAKQAKNRREASAPTSDQPKLKEVTDLTSNERSAWIKSAQEMGFPREYIEDMLGNRIANHKSTLKRIALTDTPFSEKVAQVEDMVRTSALSAADKQHLMDYWVNQLGYDREWASKLFLTNYSAQ